MSNVFLKITMDEAKAMLLALVEMVETIEDVRTNPAIPWNPMARETQREIINNSQSAMKKLSDLTGISADLPKYKRGDENEFLTKES